MSKISMSVVGSSVTFGQVLVGAALLTAVTVPVPAQAARTVRGASAWDELTDAQRQQIESGKTVYVTEPVAGTDWPKIRAYALVEATPEQAAAVFWDFDRQHEYIDALKESRVVARISPRILDVTYGIDAPWPFPMIEYTARNTMVTAGGAADGGSYRFDFRLLQSSALAKSDGLARFEPHGAGTLMNYVGQVAPTAAFSFAPPSMAQDVVESVAAHMKARVEEELSSNPDQLRSEVATLRQAAQSSRRGRSTRRH